MGTWSNLESNQALAWCMGDSPHPRYHPCKSRKRGLAQVMKSLPKYKVVWADITHAKFSKAHPEFILIDITVNFKLILLSLLFKSLFFKTNLNCSYFLLLDIFSIVTQWGFCKYVLSKKIKTDIFNKSGFRSRKLIVIV